MKFFDGKAQFSIFEQRRFGLDPAITAEGDDSYIFYGAARAAMELQIENIIALEKAGVVPVDPDARLQHAAHVIGFLGAMANERDAYCAEMMRERPGYIADMQG